MEIIDNINHLLGDDLKQALQPGAKLRIAASCFSMYAYEALRTELEKIDSLQFIFTAPTFLASEVTDKIRRERREFYIPKRDRERSLYGSEFEIQLRNKLTQKAIARECADWLLRKATFKSNRSKAPMQQFVSRPLPKNKVYQHSGASARIKDLFVQQVEQITWAYKLASDTTNLPTRPEVPEIQIFSLALKTPELHRDVLRCLDESIPLPIVYELNHDGHTQIIAAYKCPSRSGGTPDAQHWVSEADHGRRYP